MGECLGSNVKCVLFQLSRSPTGEFSLITRAYFHYTVWIEIFPFLLCKIKIWMDSGHFENVMKENTVCCL